MGDLFLSQLLRKRPSEAKGGEMQSQGYLPENPQLHVKVYKFSQWGGVLSVAAPQASVYLVLLVGSPDKHEREHQRQFEQRFVQSSVVAQPR